MFYFFFQLTATVIVGSFGGLILLLIIAGVQLNVLAIMIDINPQLAGVITDRATIVKTLQANTTPVDILATENSQEREVVGVAQNATGTSHLYGKNILPAIPNLFILPIERPLSSMLLADNTLIISKVNIADLQAIGSVLGFMYIKHYFPDRPIKNNPIISIMNQNEYLQHREITMNTRGTQLTNDIHLVEEKISSVSAGIQHDKDQVAYFQKLADEATKNLEASYRKCVNAGDYKNGVYVRFYSESYCKTQQEAFATTTDTHEKDIKDWTALLAYDQAQMQAYESYGDFFAMQQKAIEKGKVILPDELGVFEPKSTLRIALSTSNAHAIADYIEALVHEYLHYASYQDGKKLASTFFEEGLTEYFARQAIQENLHLLTNTGYPVQVKVIQQITKKIDEGELEDIYFTKDEEHLEKALNRVYGDNFYAKNISIFQTLMYTSDQEKQLIFANELMHRLGGNPLKKSDIQSTSSNL